MPLVAHLALDGTTDPHADVALREDDRQQYGQGQDDAPCHNLVPDRVGAGHAYGTKLAMLTLAGEMLLPDVNVSANK